MSIASRTTSIIGHIEDDYKALERLGTDLTNVDKNIENIASVVNDIYDKLPKVTGTGSDLSLTPTLKGGLNILPLGNCEQTGTPTPDNPIDVKVVTGDNSVVVCNKNLFDGEIEYGSINPADGSLVVNANRTRSKDFTKVKPNTTYTITRTNTYNAFLWIVGYNSNKQGITDGLQGTPSAIAQTSTGSNPTLTFTTTATTEYIKWYQTNGAGGLNEHIQIEVGSTDTSYIAHQEQSTTLHLGSLDLCKIGDYQDVITGSKDNWKVVRNVGHIVSYNGETITTDYISTTGELSTGAEVYYGLSISTEETITDTQLIESLNNMYNLMGYDGQTNITISSNSANAQMIAQISALKGE